MILALGLGWGAVSFGPKLLGMNSVIVALLAGLIWGNSSRIPQKFLPGIGFSASAMLELSIIFLGFEISIGQISELGGGTFGALLLVIFFMLLISIWLSKRLKCPGSTGLLIGFGTAICGSSAIAAVAPRISENKADAGIAVAVINLLGALGMLLFPLLLESIQGMAVEKGFFIGATLHAVGNVAGAGFALGDEAGSFALTVKLARVAMLSPAVILFSLMLNRKEGGNWTEHFKLPLYLWLFVAITLSTVFLSYDSQFLGTMKYAGKWLLSAAMFAIGTKLSLRTLYLDGKAALGFGMLIFVAQILLSILVILLIL